MKLLKKIFRKLREEQGFTLIELMVVMVILGILGAVAVPQFMGRTDSAKESAAMADLRTIQGAMEMYYLDNSFYPKVYSSISTLKTALTTGANKYLQQMNTKDPWDMDYKVYIPGDGLSYLVLSAGKDKLPAGTLTSTTAPSGDGNTDNWYVPGGLQ